MRENLFVVDTQTDSRPDSVRACSPYARAFIGTRTQLAQPNLIKCRPTFREEALDEMNGRARSVLKNSCPELAPTCPNSFGVAAPKFLVARIRASERLVGTRKKDKSKDPECEF